ncbi:hypothetical protein [uncultured Nostoc sp.]|uniref:hypothetical protein n=1 Tax=uncultured Nostoc sp. TaxID=340711 RepID=UPI0035C9824F
MVVIQFEFQESLKKERKSIDGKQSPKSRFEAFSADKSLRKFIVEEKLLDINTILPSTGCL